MKKINFKKVVDASDKLSLGISIVVAVLIGVFLGIFLKNSFDSVFFLWFGVFIGVSAAFLNVYKVYKIHKKDLDKLEKDYKYAFKKD